MSRYGIIDKTLEGRQTLYFPHFMNGAVPLDPEANHRWRMNAFATSNGADRQQLKKMCREDFLFWVVGFGSVYDAGDESGSPGRVSFLPYKFQIEVWTALWSAMYDRRKQIRVKKPRRMGLTWQVVSLFQHCWQFMGERQLLVGSHRAEEVDGSMSIARAGRFSGEWSKLLQKFDYMQIYQPKWLLPMNFIPRQEPYRVGMKIMNPESGALIEGTSASSKTAHGPRGWAAWWDEAAETETLYDIITGLTAYSPCKIWTSTIGDLSHPFSTILKDAPGIMQVAVSWDMNPEYTENLTVNEKTGKPTSPWLEQKLSEINYDQQITNTQYMADESFQVGSFYGGQQGRPSALSTIFGTPENPGTILDPVRTGELVIHDSENGPKATAWADNPNGRWRLWFDLEGGKPPQIPLVWGADIAAGGADDRGVGKSNSVLVLLDHRNLEVVATCVAHGLVPYEFAEMCCAGLRWFGNDAEPFGCYESNGPGNEFGHVLRSRFRYQMIFRDPTKANFGWHKSRDEASLLWFGKHRLMICEGRFIERDQDCAMEMREFQVDPSGKGPPVFLPSVQSPDPSGARENHGDRTIGRIAALVAAEARPYSTVVKKTAPPFGSMDYIEMEDAMQTEAGTPIRSSIFSRY